MPAASPPLPPGSPAPLQEGEREFIKQVVKRVYGPDAIVRNFGSDPESVWLHIETDADADMRKYDCLGALMTRLDRQIVLEITRRGAKARGSAKLAYRQGEIL